MKVFENIEQCDHGMMRSKERKWSEHAMQKHDEIPEVINRATRRAAASMKQRRTTNVCD
jgi:hypothetical protein